MSTQTKTERKPPIGLFAIIGIALMFAGVAISNNPEVQKGVEPLKKMGLPLDPGTAIAAIGVFLILFKVFDLFYFAPLKNAIDERNSGLERSFAEAIDLREEIKKTKNEHEAQLTQIEAEARERIQASIKEAQDMRAGIMAEASANAEAMIAKATDEIGREKDKAMVEIRQAASGLTMMATEKLLGEIVDSEKSRRLVAEFIEKAEVPTA